MRTRTLRQDRAIKLHSFTVLTCHLTLYSNISKFSTLYTATFPLSYEGQMMVSSGKVIINIIIIIILCTGIGKGVTQDQLHCCEKRGQSSSKYILF